MSGSKAANLDVFKVLVSHCAGRFSISPVFYAVQLVFYVKWLIVYTRSPLLPVRYQFQTKPEGGGGGLLGKVWLPAEIAQFT